VIHLISANSTYPRIDILEYYDTHFTSQPSLRKSLMNERNIMRDTPIHIAARYDQYYFVKALHDRKVDVSTPGAFGFTALHYAARETHTDLVRDLAVMGANLDAQSYSGDTALHLAAYNDDLETVTELLRLGASASVRNASDSTPGVVARNLKGDSVVYKFFKESNLPH
jgi:ankyrin repeat protein